MVATKRPKQLPLDEVLARYSKLDDIAFVRKVFAQMSSQAVPNKHSLSSATIMQYSSTANTLVRCIEAASGQRRESLPSLAELFLRAHGPRTVRQIVQSPSVLRKVAIIGCAIVSRTVPELTDDDREISVGAWQALLREARQKLQSQVARTGYSGNIELNALPSWAQIQAALSQLQPGSAGRLALMLYTLPFRGTWATASELLNFGHIRVYRPCELNQAPTHEQMRRMAADESKPRGWLVLSNDAKRADGIYLVVGTETSKSGLEVVVQHHKLPATLRQELGLYLQNRPAAQHFLITQQKMSVNIAAASPYTGAEGRAAFLAWVNRQVFAALDCRLRQFRAAIALHHRQAEAAEVAQSMET